MHAASYLEFPSMPGGFNDDEEWGITCTAILLNQDTSNGSMSQLIATGLAGGLFNKLENSPFSLRRGNADCRQVGQVLFKAQWERLLSVLRIFWTKMMDAMLAGSCDALTWKIKLCGV
jgi:hypothetical protein